MMTNASRRDSHARFFAVYESRDGVDDLASDSTHRVDGGRRRAARCGRTANRPRASDSNAREVLGLVEVYTTSVSSYTNPHRYDVSHRQAPTPPSLMSQHSSHTAKTLKTRTPKKT